MGRKRPQIKRMSYLPTKVPGWCESFPLLLLLRHETDKARPRIEKRVIDLLPKNPAKIK
jgi:hypothetical protein